MGKMEDGDEFMGRNGEVRRENFVGRWEMARTVWEKMREVGIFFLRNLGLYAEFRGPTATRLRGLVAVGCSLTSWNFKIWMPTATRP